MDKVTKKLFSGLLASTAFFSCTTLQTQATEFEDIENHWAKSTMLSAVEDSYISGFGDGELRPNDIVSVGQAAAILCRVLDISPETGESWDDGLSEALVNAYISDGFSNSAEPLTRKKAFLMIDGAFRVSHVSKGYEYLKSYESQAKTLSSEEADAVGTLYNYGFVKGYNGNLNLNGTITRAEFISVLYRILENGEFIYDNEVPESDKEFLWVITDESEISIENSESKRIILRSGNLEELKINELNSDASVEILSYKDINIEAKENLTLYARENGGKLNFDFSEKEPSLALYANNRFVSIEDDFESLSFTGNGNNLSIEKRQDLKNLEFIGDNNSLVFGGDIENMYLHGNKVMVEGDGDDIDMLTFDGFDITLPEDLDSDKITDETDYGLLDSVILVSIPTYLTVENELEITLTPTVFLNKDKVLKDCQIELIIDGQLVDTTTEDLVIGDTVSINHNYEYSKDMNTSSKVELKIKYMPDSKNTSETVFNGTVTLENYSDEYYKQFEVERVLSVVGATYNGNFTLEWAENNDYQDFEKEIWINAKGYTSETNYLIWINQSHQRVNIFEKADDAWVLSKEFIVGAGRGYNTPQGVFTTTYNQTGWYTSGYDVYPIVRFKYGTGLAFHSRLYYPGTKTLVDDPGIGYPISAGCIRMYDEDIQYIYDTIPSGTTVVVH